MSTELRPDGRIVFVEGETAIAWDSLDELASAYWEEQRHTRTPRDGSVPGWACVAGLVDAGVPESVDVIQALVDAATEEELPALGAGPLEQLLRHSGHGARFVAEIENRAVEQPRWRAALAGVWLGRDVPPEVRARLVRFGAQDIS